MGQLSGGRTTRNSLQGVAASIAVTSLLALFGTTIAGAAAGATHKHSSSKASAPKSDPGICKPSPEQASIGIRALQTELMVAGLKCSADQWNAFTAQFKTTIKRDADRMQGVFRKAYGNGGSSEMNSFVTQLANDASQRSNGSSEADYCKQEAVLFQKVLALTGEQLERFSAGRKLDVPTPVSLCKPDGDAVDPMQTIAAQPVANQNNAAKSPAAVTTAATTASQTSTAR